MQQPSVGRRLEPRPIPHAGLALCDSDYVEVAVSIGFIPCEAAVEQDGLEIRLLRFQPLNDLVDEILGYDTLVRRHDLGRQRNIRPTAR